VQSVKRLRLVSDGLQCHRIGDEGPRSRSGRAILEALIDGRSDPEKRADLAQGTARKKRAELIEALHGCIRPHHREVFT
jgi:hypothetical protein